jgi:hypothetical protein
MFVVSLSDPWLTVAQDPKPDSLQGSGFWFSKAPAKTCLNSLQLGVKERRSASSTIAREEKDIMSEYVSPPSLSSWGIEEVEANVCEDTFENRQKLNAVKIPFKILEPGLIEVIFTDYEGLNKHHATQFDAKKIILVNPKDPWSDYLPMDELPLDYMETAPAWIQRHLNKYRDAVDEGTPPAKLPLLCTRCKRTRADGSRCWQWSWPAESAQGFCRTHCDKFAFNATAQMAKLNDAAKVRLSQLTEPSLVALEDLVLNSTVPHVRLKAATEILDRVGIRGGTELTVSGQVDHTLASPAEEVQDRLQKLADKLKPREVEAMDPDEIIIDAEFTEDEAEPKEGS